MCGSHSERSPTSCRAALLSAGALPANALPANALRPPPTLPAVALVALSLALPALPAPLHAQTPDTTPPSPATPVTIPRLTGPVTLDGIVDEPAWDDVAPFPMTLYTPTFGGPLTEATEVRVAHDDRHLYVSGRMYDSEPDRIRTGTFYRDSYSGDDILAVVIDSYNDHETAVWFVTNPEGVRQDRTVSNDAQFTSGMPMNWDWNAHWDVAATKDDRGWYAEFRIPFSTLGFQTVDGEVTMGLITYRLIPRKNERQTYPAMDPSSGRLAFARPSRAQRVVLRDVRQATPLYVTPYALGGLRQTPVREPSAEGTVALRSRPSPVTGRDEWRSERDATAEAGLDLKWSPTSNLALDMTVNTDFAQVEADEQQINLTRFSLFFPEKRQFFQERASTFDFNTGGFFNRLFHSRRIGLDEGEPVRIYGGVRAVGRLAGTDFGFLSMQTAARGDFPSETMSVLRLRQQVFNPYSSVGAMATTRLGSYDYDRESPAGANAAYGLDAVLRLFGDEYLVVQWAQTFDEWQQRFAGEEPGRESGLLRARLERHRDDGLFYYGEMIRVGAHYRPGLGFQSRRDFDYGAGQLGYRQYRDADSPLRSRAVSVETAHYFRGVDGTAESREIRPEFEFDFKGGSNLTIGMLSSFESVRGQFRVADLFVRPGDYWFHEASVMLRLPRSAAFRGELEGSAGTFYGGSRLGLSVGPTWTVSKYLEVEAGYEVNRIRLPTQVHHLSANTTTQLAVLKLNTALNPRVSMSAFAQYNNTIDRTSVNVRFRYHFREGTDLWVVYNEGLDTARGVGVVRRPLSTGRVVMVKYSHAFVR